MSLDIERYRSGDLQWVNPKAGEITGDVRNITHLLHNSYSFTILKNNKPIAIICCSMMWDGFANLIALISDEVRGHGVELTKVCRDLLEVGHLQKNIRQYHAITDMLAEENMKWLELLGFEWTYTLPQASPTSTDIEGFIWRNNGRLKRVSSLRDKIEKIIGGM